MFGNLNWYNVVVLLLLALFIFGDRLPKIISDGMRLLRNLRRMAQNATTDLSRELGTNIQLEDLHPKTFIRKHLISEDDQRALLNPLKGVSDDLVKQTRDIGEELKAVGRGAEKATEDIKRTATLRPSVEPTTPDKPADTGASGQAASAIPQARPAYDDVT